MKTKIQIIQKIIAILVLTIMILANFATVGITAISYAIDMVVTNSDNVEFYAYLEKEDNVINSNNLKVYMEVAVKNEGYFNGQISLENSNFEFNGQYAGEYVKSVEGGTVTLNQINAGDTAKFELGIRYINSDKIDINSLSRENTVKLTGTYKNSKKDVQIKGSTKVKLNWKSPENSASELKTEMLTNKIYEINNENKRIVQVLINSKLKNDVYPIKNTKIEMNIPEGAEEVKVHSRETSATNGNAEFNENNYNYDENASKLTINLANEEKDGKINWTKDQNDILVASIIYSENKNLNKNKIETNSTITTYDDKEIKSNSQAIIENDIDGIITSYIKEDENEIYKGKLYSSEDRYYTNCTTVNIDFANIAEGINLKEQSAFNTTEGVKDANIQYIESKIIKSDFDKIFGQDGNITILDQDEKVIANINKDTKADEQGYLNINYKKGIKSITIKTTKPLTEGILKIYNKKAIKGNKYSREQIASITQIKEGISRNYNVKDEETENIITESDIAIKETNSKANVQLNKNTLSTKETNKNVEIIATLETNDETKDLYKNPAVDIVFPNEITGIKVLSAKALYKNGLKVKNSNQSKDKDGNIIVHIQFEGEQKKYDNTIVNGLEIHLYADITVNKMAPTKTTQIKVNYTNENRKGNYTTSANLNLKSQNGLALYNSISDYSKKGNKIELLNDKEAQAKIDMNKQTQTAKITTAFINNYETKLTDPITIIGKMPTKNNENTFTARISNLNVNNKGAKVYYNKNINANANDKNWTQDSKDASAYKVVLSNVDPGSIVKMTYDMTIPKGLSYNEKGILTTDLNYKYQNKNMQGNSEFVLETEKAVIQEKEQGETKTLDSGLQVNIIANVGNKTLNEGDSVFDGEIIKYTMKITNNTGKDINNLAVKATQTNGTIYDLVEKEVYNPSIYDKENDYKGKEPFWEDTNSNIKEFETINIANGKTVSINYQAVAKRAEENKIYGNISFNSNDSNINDELTTIKNNVQEAQLKLNIGTGSSATYPWYRNKLQDVILNVSNVMQNDINDVEVQFVFGKEMACDNFDSYIKEDNNITIKDKSVNDLGQTIITLVIKSIPKNQTKEIIINTQVKNFTEQSKLTEFYAKAITNDKKEYFSNTVEKTLLYGEEESNLNVTQEVKVNDQNIDQNSILKNGDKVEFDLKVQNLKDKDVEIKISNYLDMYWTNRNAKLIKNNQYTDITNLITDNQLNVTQKLTAGDTINIKITVKFDNTYITKEVIKNYIAVSDLTYSYNYDNTVEVKAQKPDDKKLNVTAVQIANLADKSVVKNGQKIEYTTTIENTCGYDRKINIINYLNKAITNKKVYLNNNDITDKSLSKNDLKVENYIVKANSKIQLKVTGTINLSEYEYDTISNSVMVKSDYPDLESNTITYYTSNEAQQKGESGSSSGGNTTGNTTNNKYDISGVAWLDSNSNGARDENEKAIKDIPVKVINAQNGETLDESATTGEDGSYKLSLDKGKYIVVFMYDNTNYYTTTYHANNVDDIVNSDAISKKITIDNKSEICGATDEINLTSNKNNIDIGLVEKSKIDFKVEKYIDKVVVTNKSGTSTHNFDKSTLAKVEIASKYLSGSTVLVEYTIKVTNVGDVTGSVPNIVDNMPSDLKFSSSLNEGWYKSGNKLYNKSLSETELDAGKSKEVKLVLTKKMTESNTGLVNNTAQITSSNKEGNFEDINNDNNTGSADLIISVKTGAAVRLALLTICTIICVMGVAYYIAKRHLNKNA